MLTYFGEGVGGRDVNPIFAAPSRSTGSSLAVRRSVLDAPAAAAILLAVTIAGAILALRLVAPPQRTAVRWFIGLVIWSTLALALRRPRCCRIVIGLRTTTTTRSWIR